MKTYIVSETSIAIFKNVSDFVVVSKICIAINSLMKVH